MFNVKVKKLKIDAIMLSRRVMNKRFSLKKMLKTLEKYKDLFKCDYHPELFHSPWFKSRDGKHGSFNVFTTGSSTVMGVKCVEDIKLIEKILDETFSEKWVQMAIQKLQPLTLNCKITCSLRYS